MIYNMAETIKEEFDKKYEEGAEKGKQEGLKEGKKEGIKEVTMRLIKKGLAIDEIKEITGLNDDEIEEIRKGISS